MPASTTALRPSASVSASNPAAAARKAVARAYQHGTEVPGLHYFYLNSRRQWIQIPPKGLTAGAVYQIQARVGKDVLAQFGYNWGSSYRHSFQGRTKSAVTTLTIAFSPQTRVLGQPVRSTSSAITRKADPGYFYTTTRELLRLAGLYPNHRYQFQFGKGGGPLFGLFPQTLDFWTEQAFAGFNKFTGDPKSLDQPIEVAKGMDIRITNLPGEPAILAGLVFNANGDFDFKAQWSSTGGGDGG